MPSIDRSRLTSGYGYQQWRGYKHTGIDIAGITPGTQPPILAPANGVVELVGWNLVPHRNGQHIVIRHDSGRRSFHGHVSNPRVRVGQRVTRRQPIATMSHTGLSASAGIHLHFEVWTGASHTTNVNPIAWLRANGWVFKDGRLYDKGVTTTASNTGGLTVSDINTLLEAVRSRASAAQVKAVYQRQRQYQDETNEALRSKASSAQVNAVYVRQREYQAVIQELLEQLAKAEGVTIDYKRIEAAAKAGAEAAIAEGIDVEITATATTKGAK